MQNALFEFDTALLDELEVLLPRILGTRYDPSELYKQSNLTKIFEAFAPSDCFSKKRFMRHCIDRLPKEELQKLSRALELDADYNNFDDMKELILVKGWKSKKFT